MDTSQQNSAESPSVMGSEKQSAVRRLSQPFKSPVVRSPASTERSSSTCSTPKSSASQRIILSKRLNSTFKSPMKPKDESHISDSPHKRFRSDFDTVALLKREEELDKEIAELEAEGYSITELDTQIELLHMYNEIKDAAQLVLGRLAELENATVREMHEKYSLPLSG